jgi:hypothetical protein
LFTLLRVLGDCPRECKGGIEREECRGVLDRGWGFIPHVRPTLEPLITIDDRLLLDHYKKFPVNPTGGLMLTKYVATALYGLS